MKSKILSPVCDFDALPLVIASGAQEVYFGTELFNARIRAKNIPIDRVKEAVTLCHAHEVSVFVTLNIAVLEKEIPSVLQTVQTLYLAGVDGLIVSDFGVAHLISSFFPDLPLHASTQCTIHNVDGVKFCQEHGFDRVVLARELSKKNLQTITERTDCETEAFVHGAHCYSVSGQCLMSFAMGGRSGNRGECAQPCRLSYSLGKRKGYLLSLKDMALASHLTDFSKMGVSSLKIEGRMKSASYSAQVTEIYRRLLDEKRDADRSEMQKLSSVFSRSGFTDGYFENQIGEQMMGVRSEEDKENSKENAPLKELCKVKLRGAFFCRLGQKTSFSLEGLGKSVTVTGEPPEQAISRPTTREEMEQNLKKFGSTPFVLESLTMDVDKNVNVRLSALNELRRKAVALLTEIQRTEKTVDYVSKKPHFPAQKLKTAFFSRPEQMPKDVSYFDVRFVPLDRYEANEKINGVALPPVIYDDKKEEICALLQKAKSSGVRYALLTNVSQIELLKPYDLIEIGDYRLNILSRPCAEFFLDCGLYNVIVSPELTLPQLRDFENAGVIAYGRFPLMTTHKCILKESVGCDVCHGFLIDRQNNKMYVEGIYDHFNVVYNSVPIDMGDRLNDLQKYSLHFLFSCETKEQIEEIIKNYQTGKRTFPESRRIK